MGKGGLRKNVLMTQGYRMRRMCNSGLVFLCLLYTTTLVRTSEKAMAPTPVFLPGEPQGQQSLVGCRLWGRTESDTTEAT